MTFKIHPSTEMRDLFSQKPFQGQDPEKARIIFLSSDANYSPEISEDDFFNKILEYQKDGIAFWHKHGCHHPFLLPDYPFNKNTGGVPFHRNFSKIGFSKKHASHICFLELLDVPTIGNKSQNRSAFFDLVSKLHLKGIDDLITGGGSKLFLIPGGVLKDMYKLKKKYSAFNWLDYNPGGSGLYKKEVGGNRVQQVYHFSSWQIHSQVAEIYTAVENCLNQNG